MQRRKYLGCVFILTSMANEKVYTPEIIEDQPFPIEEGGIPHTETQASSNQTFSPATIEEQSPPTKRISVELIGSVINTKSRKILQELQFTEMGAIQVGKYTNGVSGDMRLSPGGIVARNLSGITTFAIDGDTGDAVFAGTVQAGTLISGAVAVGDGDILIDGEKKRMVFYVDGVPTIIIGNA